MKSRRFATKHGAIEASVRSLPGPDDVPRILTYNVHRCIGMDGHLSPQRIANVIAPYDPEVPIRGAGDGSLTNIAST